MHIDFIFDTVCAWSYIAKRRMDAALKAFPKIKPAISFRPFQILPPPLFPLPDALLPNAADKANALRKQIEPVALKEGIRIAFDDLPPVVDSAPSHLLVREAFSHDPRKGSDVLESVFHAYFCEALDISDISVLQNIATHHGIDTDAFNARLLDNESLFPPSLPKHLSKTAIRAVPCFIFNRETMIFGAQSTETLKKMTELYLILRKEDKKYV